MSRIVGISAARHARQGAVRKVSRRAFAFTSRDAAAYNSDDSVTIDLRRVLDDRLRDRMRAKVAASGDLITGGLSTPRSKICRGGAIDGIRYLH